MINELNKYRLFASLFEAILREIANNNDVAFLHKEDYSNGIIYGDCSKSIYERVWAGKRAIIKKVSQEEFLEAILNKIPTYKIGTVLSCNTFYDIYYRNITNEITGLYNNVEGKILRNLHPNCGYETNIPTDDFFSQVSIKKLSIVWGKGSDLPISESVTLISKDVVKNFIYEFDKIIPGVLIKTIETNENIIAESLFKNKRLLKDPTGIYRNIDIVIERKF